MGRTQTFLLSVADSEARDPARLAASLEQFVGNSAYGLQELHADLERFVFLLGGSDGEALFSP